MSSAKKVFLDTVYHHQNLIHKVCHLYRNSKEDREDLFQEIVYQLWKSFPSYQGKAKVTSWMYRISLNTALASFRKVTIETTDQMPEHLKSPEEATEWPEEQLYLAIDLLNPVEKAIITLYLEELKYAEIADIMGITESNVGVRINRIKNKIKHLLTNKMIS
ncbi:MAG: RNA polymerase sigma factor [Candidatus Cyclobacteriaceae bacterium M3_2C_046]